MRVLHVMEATIGGTRRHIRDVAAGQLRRGLEVHVAASTQRQPEFESDLALLERSGAHVLRLPMVRAIAPPLDLAHCRALARYLERTRPDVVHTHSSKAGVLGRAASIATGIGVRVHTPHTFAFLFDAMFSPGRRRLFREIETHLAGETHALIAVSESEASTFARSGVVAAERIRIVPNGIDPAPWEAAAPIPRAALGLFDDAPLAAVVGLLNVAKGQDIALEALALRGLERLQLAFAGHGELAAELEERARRLALGSRVRFLGFRDDVPALLAAADFALVPSRWEGMPYVVLESMAAGRPVVATPVDGARDLIGEADNGFLARDFSPEGVADAVRAMLASTREECRTMSRRGREHLRARHTAETMVDGLIAVYRELA
jgi:glycosyltransferase involved in cell wall biosynthesis